MDIKQEIVNIQKIEELLKNGYKVEVDSPDGWVAVNSFVNKGDWEEYILEIEGQNEKIRCNEEHQFETNEGWLTSKTIAKINFDVSFLTPNGFKNGKIKKTGQFIPVVDIGVDHINHRYYTEDVSSHNCGKTLMMCHIAAAYVSAGLKVLYITMEMSEERIAQRIDANLLDVSLNEIENISKADFDAKVSRIRARTTGDIVIKEFPTGSGNVNHFRHLLSELNQKKRFTPDAIFVDYMNICSSARYRNGDGVNSYSVVKSIAEELRGMAVEFNVPVITATQFNREGAGSSDPEMTNTSDSFGTPMTADLQLAIYSTPDLDEQGKLVIKQLKNRYNDKTEYKKFLLRVDKSKMRLMDDDVLDSYSTSLTEKEKKNVDEMLTARKPTHDEKAFDGFDFGED